MCEWLASFSQWFTPTAASSLIGALVGFWVNHLAALWRDKAKNKREEFYRRITAPIDDTLKKFDAIADKLSDFQFPEDRNALMDIGKCASVLQQGLSRHLRRASESILCRGSHWQDLGLESYDDFVGSLERCIAAKNDDEFRDALADTIHALECQRRDIVNGIESELQKYL